MFTGAIAGHVRNLLELHRAASRIRPHPPGGHLAHPPCRLNDLKGFTRLGIVILSFQSVLGSPSLCGKKSLTVSSWQHYLSQRRTVVSLLLYFRVATLIGIRRPRPKGVVVKSSSVRPFVRIVAGTDCGQHLFTTPHRFSSQFSTPC